MSRVGIVAALAVALVLSIARPAVAQSADPRWPLAAVNFEGLQRYKGPDVNKLTGLVTGQSVGNDDLKAVATSLAETGLFAQVGYRYTANANGLTATFELQEAAWTVPVVFDNIIWISDADLRTGVAAHVPGFDGTAVEGGVANAFIAKAVERVLADRGIGGNVDLISRLDLASGKSAFAVMVRNTGLNLRTCAIRIPGATALAEKDLQSAAHAFLGTDYSKSSLALLANGTLREMYRERGHWAAAFAPPTGAIQSTSCDGITATLAVTEGQTYQWGGVVWAGSAPDLQRDLDKAFDARVGALARASQVEDGMRNVRRIYLKAGFLQQEHRFDPQLDDATRRVSFAVTSTPGRQFRMGTFNVEGLDAREATSMASRWRIKPGEVFDGTYVTEFFSEDARRRTAGSPLPTPEVRLDEEAGLANVIVRASNP